MTLITPPIALEPKRDEYAPLITSILSIAPRGTRFQSAPPDSGIIAGLPSSNNKTLFPIPPPAISEAHLIESACTLEPLDHVTWIPLIALNASSKDLVPD